MYPDSLLDDLREFYSEPDLQRLKYTDIAEIANADVNTPVKKRLAAMRVLRVLEHGKERAKDLTEMWASAVPLPILYLHFYIGYLIYRKLESSGLSKTMFGLLVAACILLLLTTAFRSILALGNWIERNFCNGQHPIEYCYDRFEARPLSYRLIKLRYYGGRGKDLSEQASAASIRPKDAFVLGFGREFGRLAAKVTIVLLGILGLVLLSIVLNLLLR